MQASASIANNVTPVPGSTRARIVALADQCVMCGLCQPQCPTYRIAQNEAESPRGRIALAKGLALGRLDAAASASAAVHLDKCLTCMNCERVCPSQVHYGELIVAARAMLRESSQPSRREKLLRMLMARSRLLHAGLTVANFPGIGTLVRSRLMNFLLRPFGLNRFAGELPRLPHVSRHLPGRNAAIKTRGRIGVFLGCVASVADRDVHASAIRLLQALGYEAVVPDAQGCCGALALHAGDVEDANVLSSPTRRAFVDAAIDVVLVSASGCFGTLRDHTFAGTTIRVREIHEFLASDEHIGELRFRPLAQRAALHTPCTQANVARAAGAVRTLLGKIPSLEIIALPDEPRCCGAAGDYFLQHAAIADALRAQKIDQAAQIVPNMLVTSNVGCRIFIDNGMRRRGAHIPVIHPVALLAQQLEN
jgi:glycolate dehydrogenase iron-sulfur subunit